MEDRFIGKRLDGRYEIHDLIGVGGMAYVYRAYDRVEDRWVAIKILKEEFSNNSEFLRRFRNESRAIAMLSHPNTVKVYDVSFGDQIQYIVMEYIDGITLKQYIEQEGAIRWNEAVHFTAQILAALEHAHSKGIIHRDIKPQNIMLLQNGTIKVADFGIARFLQSETTTMTDKAIGSVHYIAPEQARGDYITDKADIYSVGVMLYEMLTGKLPFEADNAVSVALMQLQAKPVMPRELNPAIPRGLEQITMRAMEKNPIDRFQSAGEMLDDLEAFRRNPNMVFHYDLQTGAAPYDSSARLDAYDNSRFTPSYEDNYEYEEELVRSRRSAKGAMVVKGILAAVIIVGVIFGGFYLMNNWETLLAGEVDEQVEMPQFEGQIYQTVLENQEYVNNFTFKVLEGNDPDKQPGEILKQNPKAGIMVKKGREVELTINGEVKKVQVPELTNYAQDDAINVLKSYNLGFKSETVADDNIEIGKVVSTDPPANTEVSEGTVITLKVSKGPAKKKVDVPDGLKGDLIYNVTAKLENAGLVVGTITKDDSSTLPADTVISTSPDSGTKVSEGATVDILVSSGKGAVKDLHYSVPLPGDYDRDILLQVYCNGTLVESSTVNPAYSGTYSLLFSGTSGSDTIVIQLDGQKYMELEFNYDSQQVHAGETLGYTPPGDVEPDVSGSGDVTPE
ncbi:Stk1 family PASTA domain-containing Ser/Thr kinase [uncultured Neglectibacter sp.]|uniref:Stk1 family PASTA domain-containing Ser/Thr kinase n=1 Tax=uncultured Neglectibacter sp. TaxID=1924108 RepID=UPI0034DF4820